jgi:TonB family protein
MTLHTIIAEWSRWIWPHLANHLWQTILIAVVAWGAVLLLGRVTARVRYFIWMIALVKFLLPSALLIWAIEWVGFDLSRAPAARVISNIAQPVPPIAIDRVTVSSAEPANIVARSNPQTHEELYCALTLLWGLGATALLGRWLVRRRLFKRLLRAGVEVREGREGEAFNRAKSCLSLNRGIRLMVVPGLREPGVWRVWRPIVVLPEGLAERLSDEELEALMMHELVHVVRHDNLKNIGQMLLCSLFWFHPLVWLIDRRLLGEGEVICDEVVISYTGNARTYAASLWKVAQFGFGWSFAGVSRSTGSNLSRRIKIMLDTRRRTKLTPIGRAVAGLAICVLMVFAVGMGLVTRSEAGRLAMGLVTRSDVGAAGLPIETGQTGQKRQPLEIVTGAAIQPLVTLPARPVPSNNETQISPTFFELDLDRVQAETTWGEQSFVTVPIQFDNESHIPIAVSEAFVEISKPVPDRLGANGLIVEGETKEQTDAVMGPKNGFLFRLPTMPSRHMRYTVKIMNKEAHPITRLRLAILHPVPYGGPQGIMLVGLWGKVSNGLGANEVATFSSIYSTFATVVDRTEGQTHHGSNVASNGFSDSELMNQLSKSRLKVIEASYDPYVDRLNELMDELQHARTTGIQSEEMSPSLKPAILYKEKPEYTPEARANKVQGAVIFDAVFATDGTLKNISILRGLPYGLIEQAYKSVQKISFQPAVKDGVPVNVRGNIEFDFKLDP